MAEKEKQFKHYPVDVKVRNFCGKSKLFFGILHRLRLLHRLMHF